MIFHDTITALSTPAGISAIAVIRLSGKNAFEIADKVFDSKKVKKGLSGEESHTVHFGKIKDQESMIDEVLLALFKSPHSYTGEDVVEISCHGSTYVVQRIMNLLTKNGARLAEPGEFTQRAFLNSKLDLSQAEAVADIIASGSEAEHRLAMNQMRGGYSVELKHLREQLIHFSSLIELELDFSEEDVEFANRPQLLALIQSLKLKVESLLKSFELGNVIREGIPVAITGKPNAGKSTLLNAILKEERALVSEIPGTTRDTIEEKIIIDGIPFRFIDTAGIRHSADTIEQMGVSRTMQKMETASVILYVVDPSEETMESVLKTKTELNKKYPDASLTFICNKSDLHDEAELVEQFKKVQNVIFLSALEKKNIHQIHETLHEFVSSKKIDINSSVVTSARHAEALHKTLQALDEVIDGLDKKLSGDLLAVHLRNAMHHLGTITGEIVTDDLLKNIFEKFCIGK